MKDFSLLLGIAVLWIVLGRWVLPWFGIHTCMSGGCAVNSCPSCGPGPWDRDDKDVLPPKGNQE
jgi:hypothetical protein